MKWKFGNKSSKTLININKSKEKSKMNVFIHVAS
jgi:hypothetical protein